MPTLSELLGGVPAAYEPPSLPDIDRLTSSVRRVLERWPDVVLPHERDREQRVEAMRDREAENRWKSVRLSEVTSAARILYLPEFRDRPDLAGLRRFYVDEIKASTQLGFLGAMAAVYMETYEPSAAHSQELARALATVRDRLGGRWKALLGTLPSFLDPEAAHEDVARQMLNMPDPWNQIKTIGIQKPNGPGLMEAVHLAYVRQIAPELQKPAAIESLFRWLKPEGQQARQGGAGIALDAVLTPWAQANPPEALQSRLTSQISALYGHPRLSSHAAVWNETGAGAKSVILRWLTGANIRFFLDVVTEVEESHMWEPRREFWLELFERNRIKDASVAFCPSGERVARRRSKAGAAGSGLVYARQTAGGSRSDTSLLILDLGDHIVVEGSHSYKVHVFARDNPSAPKLHAAYYDCEAIRHLPRSTAIPHLGDWQRKVRAAIGTR
jgi:hypothetical protein